MNFLGTLFGQNWEEYNAWELHWALGENRWILMALVVLAPLMLWFFWTSLRKVRSLPRKTVLYALRVAALALLLLLILQPRLELKNIQPLKNTIAVLIDDSKSMSIKTFPEEVPRKRQVDDALTRHKDWLAGLGTNYNVDYYFVSDHIDPVRAEEVAARYQPINVNTDLARVFHEVVQQYENKSLQGVLLFSDGADLIQDPEDLSEDFEQTLVKLAGPIHTLQAGTNKQFKDLAIETVDAADFGFVNQPVKVSVKLGAYAIGNKNIPVVVKEGDKILVSQVVSLKEDEQDYRVEMEFMPVRMGKHIYSVTVPVFAGEAVETNNRWDFQVKVVRDRLRVLHLNGRPSWDSRFLREVLINNPKVDLLSFFILRTLSDDVDAPTSELSLIPFPSNLLLSDYLGSFDLVVFHNFRYKPFLDKKYLSNLKSYVEEGGAFLMIGGDLSFQGGGYERTPVEEILPVELQHASQPYADKTYSIQATEKLGNHPILQLESRKDANRKAWQSLPPLQGLNLGLVAAKGAQVLATAKVDGKSLPVLAARKVGEGRTLAIATDSAWYWNFRRVGEGGSGRHYQKLWENILAWLTHDPETRLLKVETDKEKYREHEKVLVQFKLVGEDYNPLVGKPVELTLSTWPDRNTLKTESIATDENGEGRYEFHPGREGFYAAQVSVKQGDRTLTERELFSVTSPQVEFQKPRVQPELLKTLSEVSGGRYQVLKTDTRLDTLTFPNPEVEIKTSKLFVSLWDTWAAYGLILGFLFLEWYLRRKSGLS
ncbi:glutamine amidotransferase [Nitrospina gracilis]|uniref:glutamine amidotransferase n=1 Tax=Nitrospina gracilis TaxID=35801 RepID=UPI001F1DA5A7|nr:glutamine amidotransferase [Nitrospina gracilis]MCF8720135.1 putative membrane protein [Nitrospina gracilis Nb-211]